MQPKPRLSRTVFGAEGTVVTDTEVIVATGAASALITSAILLSPILADLSGPLGVSNARVGLLIAAVTAPSVVLMPFAGVLADQLGRRPLLAVGLVVFGIAGVLVPSAPTFELVLFLRGVQGAGYAFAMPMTVIVLGDIYDGPRERTAQGIRTAGIFLLSMVLPVLAGVLLQWSWRYPFYVYVVAIPVGIWAWVTLPDEEPTRGRTVETYIRDLGGFLRERTMFALQLTFAVRFFVLYGFLTYVSVYGLVELGLTTLVIASVVSLKSVFSVLGSTQSGRLTDGRAPERVGMLSFLAIAFGMGLAGLWPSPWTLLVGTVLLGLGDGVIGPLQKSLVTHRSPRALRAGATSVSFVFQNVGRSVGPLFGAVVLEVASPSTAFVLFGVLGAGTGGALLAYLWRTSSTG